MKIVDLSVAEQIVTSQCFNTDLICVILPALVPSYEQKYQGSQFVFGCFLIVNFPPAGYLRFQKSFFWLEL